jgi:alpha-beta hydrolase superfamily lysophospholipase
VIALIRDASQSGEKVSFCSSTDDSRSIAIRGILLRPRAHGSRKLPGVVFCHGLMANKEIYLGLCRKIANLGVAVLAIDLRGHGHSGGASDFSKSEHMDIHAALEFLKARNDIDSGRLAVVGHSLGGIVATRACFRDPQYALMAKTVIALYCWKGMREAVEAVFGPLENFVARWWPFFGWSRQFAITDEEEMAARSVIEHVRPDISVNYLLIAGSRDPLTDMHRSAEIVAQATGRPEIEAGVLYGAMQDETARKLVVVKGANHLTVASRKESFEAIREWLHASLEPEPLQAASTMPFGRLRKALRLATVILFGLSSVTLASVLKNLPMSVPVEKSTAPMSMIGGGLLLFLVCSALAVPFSRLIALKPFAPHWGADIISLVVTSRTLLFGPLLVVLLLIHPGSNDSVFSLLGLVPAQLFSSLIVAAALFGWLVCFWNLVARVNMFPRFWPVVGGRRFLLLFGALFISYVLEEALFRGMIQPRLSGFPPVSVVAVSGLIYSTFASVALIGSLYTLFPSPAYAAMFRSRSVQLMPVVFVVALIAFSAHGFLAAFLFHLTGSILAPALFLALLISFLFSGPTGVRTFR